MNTHLDKTTDHKNNAAANDIAIKQGGGEAGLQIENKRPIAITQRNIKKAANNGHQAKQLKNLQEMANNSGRAKLFNIVQSIADSHSAKNTIQKKDKLEEVSATNPVVQRVIEIVGDRVYKAGDAKALIENYPNEWKGILNAIREFGFAAKTIEDAVADVRICSIKKEVDAVYGTQWIVNVEEPAKQGEGGGESRDAGESPVLVLRPNENFEEMKIKGLIMCVGIIIEARNEAGIQAAAACHFVTPTSIAEGNINEKGLQGISKQISLVREHGKLSAILMPTEGASTQKTKPQKDAQEAVTLILKLLQQNDVKEIAVSEGDSSRTYRLLADGSSTLN